MHVPESWFTNHTDIYYITTTNELFTVLSFLIFFMQVMLSKVICAYVFLALIHCLVPLHLRVFASDWTVCACFLVSAWLDSLLETSSENDELKRPQLHKFATLSNFV